MTAPAVCKGCGCQLVPWSQQKRPEHARVHRGKGLCSSCWARVNRPPQQVKSRHTAKLGSPPAVEFIDPIAVERAVNGDPPALMTTLEIREAVRQLDSRGYTANDVAERIGVTTRTVTRHRAAIRAQASKEAAA